MPEIDATGLDEEGFLKAAIDAIGSVNKVAGGVLDKESFIRVFKYTGEFAKFKNQEMKKVAQANRIEHFENGTEYLKALKANITEEEKAFESSSVLVFDALSISTQCFEKSQQALMNDPYVSMELYNLGISMEKPAAGVPSGLTPEKTISLVKGSNDYAFDMFKREFASQTMSDPMLMPVLISAIAHDWVKINHGYDEDDFKAALFQHKIYENAEVSEHMQQKQMELMMMAMQMNP